MWFGIVWESLKHSFLWQLPVKVLGLTTSYQMAFISPLLQKHTLCDQTCQAILHVTICSSEWRICYWISCCSVWNLVITQIGNAEDKFCQLNKHVMWSLSIHKTAKETLKNQSKWYIFWNETITIRIIDLVQQLWYNWVFISVMK